MKNNDRKIQIIKAADKRFARHGFHKTNMDEIARDIRIGKPTLYYYFESKDALYIEVINWECGNFLEQVKNILNDEESSVTKRLLNYFLKKNEVRNEFKLIFEVMIQYLSDKATDAESEILRNLLANEEEMVRKILLQFYKDKLKAVSKSLPHSISLLGWMIAIGNSVNERITTDKEFLSAESLEKVIEGLLI